MEEIRKWRAFDKTEHDSKEECRRYESDNAQARLIGLSPESLARAIMIYTLVPDDRPREDVELAVALEDVGVALQRARIAKREIKRERRAKSESAPAPARTSTSPEDRREPFASDEAEAEDHAAAGEAALTEDYTNGAETLV